MSADNRHIAPQSDRDAANTAVETGKLLVFYYVSCDVSM